MKKVGIALIVIGIAILSYTGINQYIAYKERQALIETALKVKPIATDQNNKSTNDKANNKQQYNAKNPIGVLEIPKIDLTVPIVEGATQESLKNAVGHIEGTGKLGEINNNYAIAGHRSHTTGRFFNRLDEIELGDELIIKTATGEFKYLVFEKKVVTPDKVDVLNPIEGKSVVTLITCHPLYSNKQRLVVFAELKK
ncbi:MAG: class D sortase [Clostridiales bacterium]|nr:class D sortase [Clostridiales bacterium]